MKGVRISHGTDLAAMLAGTVKLVEAGNFTSISVLVDYLEERSHSQAKPLRKEWDWYKKRFDYYATHDFSRDRRWCRNSANEAIQRRLASRFKPIAQAIAASCRPKKPPRDVREVRAEKAATYLARWEAKLKLAKGKVAKYRRKVEYYKRKETA